MMASRIMSTLLVLFTGLCLDRLPAEDASAPTVATAPVTTAPPLPPTATTVPPASTAAPAPVASPTATPPPSAWATAPQLSPVECLSATEALSEFMPSTGLNGHVRGLGNGISIVALVSLSQALREIQPDLHLDVGQPNRKELLPTLLDNTIDLAVLPYLPSPEQLQKRLERTGGPVENLELVAVPFALNPIVFYVNQHNPVPSLSLAQVGRMVGRHLNGQARAETWSDIGVTGPLASRSIVLVMSGRDFDRNAYFRRNILKIDDIRLDVRFAPTPGAALCEVGADPGAFCIASLLYATPATRPVPLCLEDGTIVTPDMQAVQSKAYPLSNVMTLVAAKRDGQWNPLVRETLRYAVSRRGQRQIAALGVFPLTPAMQQKALETLR